MSRTSTALAVLIMGVFALHVALSARPFDPQGLTRDGIGTSSVGFYSANTSVGTGYYAELGNAIASGHTYFGLPYDSRLLAHPNPYGREAFQRGIVIQDASFYQGKYYLYFGPAPVLTIYLPFKWAFGAFPSDALVISALAIAHALLVGALLIRYVPERKWIGLALFCLLVANPVMLRSLQEVHNAHGVSRLFAGACILAACWFLLRLASDIGASGETKGAETGTLLAISLLLCAALGARVTALPDVIGYSLLVGALLWRARGNPGRRTVPLALLYAAPIVATAALLALYNYARFDDPFETGMRFQTHGIDLAHGESLLRPPQDTWQFLGGWAHRLYEYFVLLPTFESDGPRVRYDVVNPVVSGAYSEGAVGFLAWAPIVLLVPAMLIRAMVESARGSGFRFESAFLWAAMAHFLINFTLIAIIPTAAIHYTLEFMPRLALVVVGSALVAGQRSLPAFPRHLAPALGILTVVLSLGGMIRGDLL